MPFSALKQAAGCGALAAAAILSGCGTKEAPAINPHEARMEQGNSSPAAESPTGSSSRGQRPEARLAFGAEQPDGAIWDAIVANAGALDPAAMADAETAHSQAQRDRLSRVNAAILALVQRKSPALKRPFFWGMALRPSATF